MSVLSVNLAATSVEGALFGIFLSLAVASICLLVNRRLKEVNARTSIRVSWFSAVQGVWRSTLFVSTLLFVVIITAHWILGVFRLFDAFLYFNGGDSAPQYFANLRHPLEVSRTALLIATMLIGDLILIHRTWIVWNRNHWIVLAPVISSLGLITSGIGVVRQFSTNSPTDNVFAARLTDWIVGVVASTLITKIYGTIMIAYRIYAVNKALKNNRLRSNGPSVLDILMILIESSTLSTVWTVFFAAAYASKDPVQSFPTSCSPAINGVAFMLITVRVGLGWDLQLGITGSQNGPQAATLSPFQAYPLRTIRLQVTRTVEQRTDFALRSREDKTGDKVLDIRGQKADSGSGAGQSSDSDDNDVFRC